jgi:uncharacterized protein YjaZ
MVATLAGEFPPPPTKRKIICEFTKHKDYLYEVNNYLLSTNFTEIDIITNTDTGKIDFMYVYDFEDNDSRYKKEKIDENVQEYLQYITKNFKYTNIGLTGNTIYFERWGGLKYKAKGIAFTIDGNQPELDYLFYYEQLNEPNWYYYEINYAEWRVNH